MISYTDMDWRQNIKTGTSNNQEKLLDTQIGASTSNTTVTVNTGNTHLGYITQQCMVVIGLVTLLLVLLRFINGGDTYTGHDHAENHGT